MKDDQIEKVKKIISQSGNTFHSSVLQYMTNRDWTVLISPYYNDNVTNKPREIDLIVEKEFNITNFHREPTGIINVRLFIECKYIPKINVFWFYFKDRQKVEDLITQTTQIPVGSDSIENHHYLGGTNRVAKLFSDERIKSTENETFFKALNQCLNAMVYYRYRGSIIKNFDNRNRNIQLTLNYPVILCNSFENLYQVEMELPSEPKRIEKNFQLEVNYAYMTADANNINEFFLIDIIDFNLLDQFLEVIENDVENANQFKYP